MVRKKLLGLKDENPVPAKTFNDGVDYVPAKKQYLLGHHFTTIAGTGPIVGPAIGVIWGWLPAFLWVFLGPIIAGGVQDFTSLIISSRHGGKTIGEMTRGLVSNRVGIIFFNSYSIFTLACYSCLFYDYGYFIYNVSTKCTINMDGDTYCHMDRIYGLQKK